MKDAAVRRWKGVEVSARVSGHLFVKGWALQSPSLTGTPIRDDRLPCHSGSRWEQYSQMWEMLAAESREA